MISRTRTFSCLLAVACACLLASAAGSFGATPGWQPIGVTGPTVVPPVQSEQQKVFVDASAGSFTLSARPEVARGFGDFNFSEITNVSVTSGAFAPGQTIEGFGIRQGTTISTSLGGSLGLSQAVESNQEKQTPFSAFGAASSTSPLAYNATAADVQAALESLAPIGAGNVQVSGGPGDSGAQSPYVVNFQGALANTDVGLLEADSSSSTGNVTTITSVFGGPGVSKLAMMAQNVGDAPSSGAITFKATLPAGTSVLGKPTTGRTTGLGSQVDEEWACGGSTASEIICTRAKAVRPSLIAPAINATIVTAPGAESGEVQMEVSGGGAGGIVTEDMPLTVSATPASSGLQAFTARAYDANGTVDTRAGGHPTSASTAIFFNTKRTLKGHVAPAGEIKDLVVKLPPGFLGSPMATPACPESTPTQDCPLDSMVAVVAPVTRSFGTTGTPSQVFNTETPFGYPAKFRFRVFESADLNVVGTLRSDEDYGVDAASLRTPELETFYGAFFTFWGEPASPSHNSVRCSQPGDRVRSIELELGCKPSGAPNRALLTNPTNCAEQAVIPPSVGLSGTLWVAPNDVFSTAFAIPPVTGCEELKPEAEFSFGPDSQNSDSPASFTTTVSMPTEGLTDPTKLVTPEIKDTVVNLPEGVILNAAAADGLAACSLQQIGYMGGNFPMPNPMRFNKSPNTCPDASKVGTVELETPLLAEPLDGVVYLAAQGGGNPFGSLFAIYLVIEDPDRGIVIKLPGRVEPNGATGQVQATFANLPQLPFASLDLKLKGGPRSPLATPDVCGTYGSAASFTPWSAPESGSAADQASFAITNGADGGLACPQSKAQRPFGPGFEAGSKEPTAGGHSPFTLRITRPDGSQELNTISVSTPPGFAATLRGVAVCSDAQIAQALGRSNPGDGAAELQSPSCPSSSQVGTTTIGAGVGPNPYYVKTGKIYRTGPYKGAQLSLTFIVPAVAGPFDLGVQVVRTALRVNPVTAQITAESDPIPQILQGVPLKVRDVRVDIDRAGFALNPTNCEPMAVSGQITGGSGAVAAVTNHFQVDGCENLGFKPKLQLTYKGPTKRTGNPALRAVLTQPPGQANISRTVVVLPKGSIIDQRHVNNPCTRAQYAENACPAKSVLGTATAWSPLLDQPLTGKVYFRSNGGARTLPDLVASLKGEVDIELVGFVDAVENKKAGTSRVRNTFAIVPDAPVSKFVLNMKGGKLGLIQNSKNLCKQKNRATVKMGAQNGRRLTSEPVVKTSCKKKKKAKKKKG